MRLSFRSLGIALLCLMAQVSGAQGQTEILARKIVEELLPAGEGLPLFRASGSVAVLAVATDRWLAAPAHPRELLGNYQFLPDETAAQGRGQLFDLLEAEGDWDLSKGTGQFLAVPWTLGCGCAEVGWQEPVWVPAGDTVAFLLTPTRRNLPADAPPAFDVLGWHQPYPIGDFIPFWRKVRKANPEWLTVREFFEFLQTLPTERTLVLEPALSLDGIHRWLEENPEKKGTFPIPSVLLELEERLGADRSREEGKSPPPGTG